MGTKNNPGEFDCYANAEADEPLFILLARDQQAPNLVEAWADLREYLIGSGHHPRTDQRVVAEARECAQAMRAWRAAHRPPKDTGLIPGQYAFEKFGRDAEAYDLGDAREGGDDFGDGAPGVVLFSNALQCWASCQPELVSVARSAATFRVPPSVIIQAVEHHGFMFLTGPHDDYSRLMIEHEGE